MHLYKELESEKGSKNRISNLMSFLFETDNKTSETRIKRKILKKKNTYFLAVFLQILFFLHRKCMHANF